MSVRLVLESVFGNPGNRDLRLRRLARAAGWQVRKRLKPRPCVIELANGAAFKAYPDCVVSSALVYADWPEYNELTFLRRHLRRGELIVDVGANVGHVSLLLGDVVGAENVHAFEPGAVAFERLAENWSLNRWPAKNLHRTALGERSGAAFLTPSDSPRTTNSLVLGGDTTGMQPCAMCRLDDLEHLWRERDVGLLKMDVEGHETEVLRGAHDMFARSPPRVIMLESLGGCLHPDIARFFSRHAYAVMQLDDEHTPNWSESTAQNLLALRSDMREEMRSATR